MSKSVNLIFPNQLFENHPLLENGGDIYLIEEYLFFKKFKFHKQKIAFHRASMNFFQTYLEEKGAKVIYIESDDELSDMRNFHVEVDKKKITEINVVSPSDDWLERRLKKVCENIKLNILDSPQFINDKSNLAEFFNTEKKFYFQTAFYKQERIRLNILMTEDGKPEGEKWTFDVDNRKKYPKTKTPPSILFPESSEFWKEAIKYTEENFENNPGELSENPLYPITHEESQNWLNQFFDYRFQDFGIYEDSIVEKEAFLNHSVLSPLLNSGLLKPVEVINQTLIFAEKNKIPLNSLEGFIRQIIGWREFMHGMYLYKSRFSRTQNFFNFKRKIPKSFYDGTTGIPPIDETIKKVLKNAYCHHIERLMILGNFMLLCEFDPKEIYKWFMELFIDAYDWVMVPNIYGMSQFADGGTFATKPYLSGSNYIKKMSDYSTGDWEKIWDGLFWRFVGTQEEFFKKNPRVSMMHYSFQKMDPEKKEAHLKHANDFLKSLDAL
ncbi:cryptochrome/photolyase family protein [Kaistella jeonii]|uniref:Deoxyribodipyrimidine photolyase n=1 Tax=Kaistella jeonii TaxID=266749 RepID=A0A0C1D9U1_9FLAO|nr:cryptochrome/photolyase family protein [Kaistella jeonii]KIA90680.1 deoxyribodipyrimidine photolyase [Kaistella jeonii]SFB69202.1 deoxyribodipyrimidine photolyase-related protein [Kaistella jeonii]VEI94714.1 deoxyribodipyrimidine photolyase [Kaistella jeonii]